MRIWLSAVACGLALAQPVTQSRIGTGLNSIQEPDLRAGVEYLASDALQGRLSLEPGSETAAKWVAAEFKKAGLKPLAAGSFLQPVALIEYQANREASSLTVKRDGKVEKFSFPDAFGSFPRDITTSGAIVFAGYGISAPELDYDDYAGIDVRGKLVLIFDHEPQETDPNSRFNGKGNTLYAGSFMKTLTAQKHGAAG